MNGKAAIKATLEASQSTLTMFVDDLSDADILVRPFPNANHIAWQLGNVIYGDIHLLHEQLPEVVFPELPPGFVENHGTQGASNVGPAGYLTKAEYLALLNQVRSTTIAALDSLSDTDLDRPTDGFLAQFAPTLGHIFIFASKYTLMHAGQFSVIRRMLDKPVLF